MFDFEVTHHMAPSSWPTNEELLELNFDSIVSDCRALISGTLSPRPWYDIAGTWYSRSEGNNSGRYRYDSKPVREMRASVRRRISNTPQMKLVSKMQRVLVANGMTPLDALLKARKLLLTTREEV